MLLACILIAIGLPATVQGVRLATGRRRPVDIAGALLAAAGLAVALLGLGRLLSGKF